MRERHTIHIEARHVQAGDILVWRDMVDRPQELRVSAGLMGLWDHVISTGPGACYIVWSHAELVEIVAPGPVYRLHPQVAA